jgi:hypothetical protein
VDHSVKAVKMIPRLLTLDAVPAGVPACLQTATSNRMATACTRLLLVLLVAFAATGITGFCPLAFACGGVDDWIRVYEDGDRHRALFHLLDCASSYRPLRDDAALLPVVADALERDRKVADLGMAVFRHFNCLYGARGLPTHGEVLAEFEARGGEVSLKRYRRWMVVTARSGAWMREGPSDGARGVATLPQGLTVRRLEERGEWVKVRPVGPSSVDPRFEGKEGFVYASLLAPY